jgi:hypothetical protein
MSSRSNDKRHPTRRGVPTGPAYALLDDLPNRVSGDATARLLNALSRGSIEEIGAAMGNDFDPATGPILAGQGILLSSFQEGEYRLGITVTDLSSRQTLSRDVMFSVAGS